MHPCVHVHNYFNLCIFIDVHIYVIIFIIIACAHMQLHACAYYYADTYMYIADLILLQLVYGLVLHTSYYTYMD